MPEKKLGYIGLKVDDGEKASITAAAKRAGVSVGEYLRRCHVAASQTSQPKAAASAPAPSSARPAAPPVKVSKVDDVGPDGLWSGERAL